MKQSQYIGVSLDPSSGKWRARIRINGKQKTLGRASHPAIAAQAYDDAHEAAYGTRPNNTETSLEWVQQAMAQDLTNTAPQTGRKAKDRGKVASGVKTKPTGQPDAKDGASNWTMNFQYAPPPAQRRLPNT